MYKRQGDGGRSENFVDVVKGFDDGSDRIQLEGIRFSDLNIFQGSGSQINHTIIRHYETKEYLLLVQNINWQDITIDDFITDPNMEAIDTVNNWHLDHVAVSQFNTKFPNQEENFKDEARLQSLGGASITIGSQRIYTGSVSYTHLDVYKRQPK